MQFLCYLRLLILVIIYGEVIVLDLLCLLLQGLCRSFCSPLLHHNHPLHLSRLRLILPIFLIEVDLDDQRLRQKIEAVDHQNLRFPEVIIKKGHLEIIEIALYIFEGLLYELYHVS